MKNFKRYLFRGLVVLTAITFTACNSSTGISAYKVDDLLSNPRIHEGKEISIVGKITKADDSLALLGILAKIEGSSPDKVVYLINFAAHVEFDKKYVVKGNFAAITLPLLGSYLVIDAKSVEKCAGLNLC